MTEIVLRNCRFKRPCPMKWDDLVPTERPGVRYCPQCDRGVHLCRTGEELRAALQANRCVAIPMQVEDAEPDDASLWKTHFDDDTYFEQ